MPADASTVINEPVLTDIADFDLRVSTVNTLTTAVADLQTTMQFLRDQRPATVVHAAAYLQGRVDGIAEIAREIMRDELVEVLLAGGQVHQTRI